MECGSITSKHPFLFEEMVCEKSYLIILAEELGLPLIERLNFIFIIGQEQILIFETTEETKCQLIY